MFKRTTLLGTGIAMAISLASTVSANDRSGFLLRVGAISDFNTKTNTAQLSDKQYYFKGKEDSGRMGLGLSIGGKFGRLKYLAGVEYFMTKSHDLDGVIKWEDKFRVSAQESSVIGIKLAHFEYGFTFNKVTIAPLAGLGLYYGKNSMTVQGQDYYGTLKEGTTTLHKGYANIFAGVTGSVAINNKISPYISMKINRPVEIAKGLKKEGYTISGGDSKENQMESLDMANDVSISGAVGLNVLF